MFVYIFLGSECPYYSKRRCVFEGGIYIIQLLGPFFGVQNFEYQYFWGFQKKEYFMGMKILWIFLWGHCKLDYVFYFIFIYFLFFLEGGGGVILYMYFRVFS